MKLIASSSNEGDFSVFLSFSLTSRTLGKNIRGPRENRDPDEFLGSQNSCCVSAKKISPLKTEGFTNAPARTRRHNFLELMHRGKKKDAGARGKRRRGSRREMRWYVGKRERWEFERKTGDVKCRARTPARNCSLRFSREHLRRDLRLRRKVSRRAAIISDAR